MSDCIIRNKCLTGKGYSQMRYKGKRMYAHRVAYIEAFGEIPKGLVIDHLCRVTNCINPEHLEAVTPFENLKRSPIYGANKTHCKNGHEYTPENTYRGKQRHCKICTLKSVKRYRDKQKTPSSKQ